MYIGLPVLFHGWYVFIRSRRDRTHTAFKPHHFAAFAFDYNALKSDCVNVAHCSHCCCLTSKSTATVDEHRADATMVPLVHTPAGHQFAQMKPFLGEVGWAA
mmetsp:Transcript_34467/g.50033  ORF Transcript_34467/g.50033 Transcript_34467/m.50033 type:complete len:102 (-) Transcript_34467:983-1288(-)